jgi:hypothetical protein
MKFSDTKDPRPSKADAKIFFAFQNLKDVICIKDFHGKVQSFMDFEDYKHTVEIPQNLMKTRFFNKGYFKTCPEYRDKSVLIVFRLYPCGPEPIDYDVLIRILYKYNFNMINFIGYKNHG